jgi:AcrR family transcriptional regulator
MERKRSDAKREPAVRKPSGAAVMQESVTRAIEAALFQEWARTGYAALSVEAVAKRAGVGKAAIYRRWPSKLALVSDVLTRVGSNLAVMPDTGNLRTDVAILLRQLRRILRHPLVARILPDLHAEMPRTPELAKAVRSRLQVYRRAQAEAVLRRAMQRGELPANIDLELATDLLGSMIYWRMIITRHPADRAYLNRLTDLIVGALKACPGLGR